MTEIQQITDSSVATNCRGQRKTLIGRVVSAKMIRSITVAVTSRKKHPVYGRIVQSTSKVMAHDENQEAGPGDLVELMETRPLSRLKRWRLVRIIEKAR